MENSMDREELRKCKDVWLQTLASFGIKRNLMQIEETEIARAMQKHGAEAVELALFGARFEPATESFDPRKYVKISRFLRVDARGEEVIDRFANLGAMERSRQERVRDAAQEMKRRNDEILADTGAEFKQDPEKVREFMANFLPKLKAVPK
jgi:hypothetical protein